MFIQDGDVNQQLAAYSIADLIDRFLRVEDTAPVLSSAEARRIRNIVAKSCEAHSIEVDWSIVFLQRWGGTFLPGPFDLSKPLVFNGETKLLDDGASIADIIDTCVNAKTNGMVCYGRACVMQAVYSSFGHESVVYAFGRSRPRGYNHTVNLVREEGGAWILADSHLNARLCDDNGDAIEYFDALARLWACRSDGLDGLTIDYCAPLVSDNIESKKLHDRRWHLLERDPYSIADDMAEVGLSPRWENSILFPQSILGSGLAPYDIAQRLIQKFRDLLALGHLPLGWRS